LIARKNPDGSVQYDHADHLGSVGVITDAAGGVVEQTTYSPYGEELSGGNADVKGYTGQYDDEATGQMYYGARYYKPEVAMFVQGDPMFTNRAMYQDVPPEMIFNPQGLNKYSYVLNNPYIYVDPTGKIVVYFGIRSEGGLGVGAGGSAGYAIGYSKSEGFKQKIYTKKSFGYASPTGSVGLELGVAPFLKSPDELSGTTLDLNSDVLDVLTIGSGGSVPYDEEDDEFKWKKFALEVTGSLDINLPIPASVSLFRSETKVFPIGDGSNPHRQRILGGGGSRVFKKNKDLASLGSLAKLSSNANPSQTAGDIIRQWRSSQK